MPKRKQYIDQGRSAMYREVSHAHAEEIIRLDNPSGYYATAYKSHPDCVGCARNIIGGWGPPHTNHMKHESHCTCDSCF